MNLLHDSPHVARKRAAFELLRKEAGEEIDYILPFISDVLNEKVSFFMSRYKSDQFCFQR